MSGKRDLAVFTIVQDEPVFLPIWVRHYLKDVEPQDIYVINHDSQGEGLRVLEELQSEFGIQRVDVHHRRTAQWGWIREIVQDFQHDLLDRYETVINGDVDEIIGVPGRDLREFLADYELQRCNGFEIIHHPDEPDMALDQPVMPQRKYWFWNCRYCKVLVSKQKLHWQTGLHNLDVDVHTDLGKLDVLCKGVRGLEPMSGPPICEDLILVHLRKMDYRYALSKNQACAERLKAMGELPRLSNAAKTGAEFDEFMYARKKHWVEIPEKFRSFV